MRNIYLIIFGLSMNIANLFSQTIIEKINHKLDTQPYFDLSFDYNKKITFPDSIKRKIISSLQKNMPRQYADSIFTIDEQQIDRIRKTAWLKCENDTACFEREYKDIIKRDIDNRKNNYYNRCLNGSFILSCASWDFKEAIPYLEEELNNNQCNYLDKEINLALAKFGNDSIYKRIKKARFLSYLISHTELDTIDTQVVYGDFVNIFPYGISTFPAYYLTDKDLLYDMLDLLYLKGRVPFVEIYTSVEVSILMDFSLFLFRDIPHIDIDSWNTICEQYLDTFIDADKDKNLYKKVSSHEYKKKIIEELRQWIDNNVIF